MSFVLFVVELFVVKSLALELALARRDDNLAATRNRAQLRSTPLLLGYAANNNNKYWYAIHLTWNHRRIARRFGEVQLHGVRTVLLRDADAANLDRLGDQLSKLSLDGPSFFEVGHKR